jgi:YebC/PmpR family DNA-binding regulatory protein
MSGHSKWANIKHRKSKSDSVKGRMFTKIGREIAIVVKEGGADPETNARLRDVIAKAKTANMPGESIARSIKKAAGDADSTRYEQITYEGYGPEGAAVIVEAMTDSRNRTAGEIRHLFDKYGGNLGATGCVSFIFNKKGVILIEKTTNSDEDSLMTDAIDSGAEDFNTYDEYFEVLTAPDDFSKTRESLEKKKKYEFVSAAVEMIPVTTTLIKDPARAEQMEKLIDALEDLEDVQNVYHNWEQ